jgi:GNAT superfamily N-acetyltransferase
MLYPGDSIRNEKWEFARVYDFSVFATFDCGDGDLNDFIRNDAAIHKEELIAETYSFKFTDIATPPLAFVSLLNESIELTTNRLKRRIDNRVRVYPEYPAVKIGRLGVDKDYCRLGIGSTMLDILKEMFTTNNRTGCRFITVDAYNSPEVLSFYQRNDFEFLPTEEPLNGTRIMFFDLKNWPRG